MLTDFNSATFIALLRRNIKANAIIWCDTSMVTKNMLNSRHQRTGIAALNELTVKASLKQFQDLI